MLAGAIVVLVLLAVGAYFFLRKHPEDVQKLEDEAKALEQKVKDKL